MRARERDEIRGVVRRDHGVPRPDERERRLAAEPQRKHATLPGRPLLQPAPVHRHRDRVLQRQAPRRPGRRDLPHRVAEDGVRLLAPRPHQAAVAVGVRLEGLAPAVRREEVTFAHDDRVVGEQHHVHAAGERERTFLPTQRLAREVQRHERGRARRVHGQARAAEVEHVGEPVREQRHRAARRRVVVDGVLVGGGEPREHRVEREAADEHARRGAREPLAGHARVLEGLPRHLQQQALLRVERPGLPRRDAEEARFEREYVLLQEAAAAHPGAARGAVVVLVEVDAPAVGRLIHHAVRRLGQEPQVGRRVVGSAGKTAGHADNCDGLEGVGAVGHRGSVGRCPQHAAPGSAGPERDLNCG